MAGLSHWAELPDVVITHIFKSLSHLDKLAASSSCQKWRACLFQKDFWAQASIELNCKDRKRSRFFATQCGRFVCSAIVKFNSRSSSEATLCLEILQSLSFNRNLRVLSVQPSNSCLNLPKYDTRPVENVGNRSVKRLVYLIKQLIVSSRCLQHFSLGFLEVLQDNLLEFVELLAQYQGNFLFTLHLGSVKELEWDYRVICVMPNDLSPFQHLQTLSLDYDNLTTQLLLSLARPRCTQLRELFILLHGVWPEREHIPDSVWRSARCTLTSLQVTLTILHTSAGVAALTSILTPHFPLLALRQYFCRHICVAALQFVALYLSDSFQQLDIVEQMNADHSWCSRFTGARLFNMHHCEQDPFVMIAWRCHSLVSMRLIGIEVTTKSVDGIAKLCGHRLKRLVIPMAGLVVDESDYRFNNNIPGLLPFSLLEERDRQDFCEQVSSSLGRRWCPAISRHLPRAVFFPTEDAEDVYMNVLLGDQLPAM